MTETRNNIGRILGVLVVIVLIIAVFLLFVDINAVIKQLGTANYGFLALASLMLIIGLIFFAVRWRLLLGNIPGLTFTFHACNIGHAGNIIIPFRGGDALRIVVMGHSGGVSYTASTSSFVVERLFEQIMRMLALVGAVLIGAGLQISTGTLVAGFGVVLLAFGGIALLLNRRESTVRYGTKLLARIPRVTEESAQRSLTEMLDNLSLVSKPRLFAQVMFWSILSWTFFWLFFLFTLMSLQDGFPQSQWLAVSLGALAFSPPSAPTQPGIFHASVVVPLATVGFDAASLTAYAVLLHLQEMFWMISLGLIGVIAVGISPKQLFKSADA